MYWLMYTLQPPQPNPLHVSSLVIYAVSEKKDNLFLISVRRGVATGSTGVVLSTPVLPEAVPGIGTDPVSF